MELLSSVVHILHSVQAILVIHGVRGPAKRRVYRKRVKPERVKYQLIL